MKFFPAATIREWDAKAIRENLATGETLMGRAARGCLLYLRALASAAGWARPRAWLFAGKGNNGGDASALASLLKEDGWSVDLWLAASPGELQGEALLHWNRANTSGVRTKVCASAEDWRADGCQAPVADVLIDGLLGTGFTGAPNGAVAAAIAALRRHAPEAIVVSIDLPSGLNADTGDTPGECVRADWTLTLGAPKAAFALPGTLRHTGTVSLIPLGFPAEWITPAKADELDLITAGELVSLLPPRAHDSHKGTFGRVLIIGGSRGLTGAAVMAARAALRSGTGLVTVLTPASLVSATAAGCPEAMVYPAPETPKGGISSDIWAEWLRIVDDFDVVLIGPGLGPDSDSLNLVRKYFTSCKRPVVLDADAITCFEGRAHWMEKSSGPVLITPHPGELARVLGTDVASIQNDRIAAVHQATRATGATVMLKGAGTLVASLTGAPVAINLTGNPGLAKAGTGDVLAGLTAGLIAQGLSLESAARLAAYIHGRAGDYAALRSGPAGLTALDVIDQIPAVLRELAPR